MWSTKNYLKQSLIKIKKRLELSDSISHQSAALLLTQSNFLFYQPIVIFNTLIRIQGSAACTHETNSHHTSHTPILCRFSKHKWCKQSSRGKLWWQDLNPWRSQLMVWHYFHCRDLRLSVRLQVLIGSFYFERPIAVTRRNAGNQTQLCLRRIQA